jgi:hypothetical protein
VTTYTLKEKKVSIEHRKETGKLKKWQGGRGNIALYCGGK